MVSKWSELLVQLLQVVLRKYVRNEQCGRVNLLLFFCQFTKSFGVWHLAVSFFCWTRFLLIFVDSVRFGFHGRLSEPWFSLDTEKRNSIKYVAYFVFFVAIWFWQDSEYDHHWDDQIDLLFGARKRLWWWTFQLLATRSMNRNCLDKWSFYQILDSR